MKKPNNDKRVHYVIHFIVVLRIGRDITLRRLGLTVVFGLISCYYDTLSEAEWSLVITY
jgi:hypothetical protein